jgi:hypothetical protein
VKADKAKNLTTNAKGESLDPETELAIATSKRLIEELKALMQRSAELIEDHKNVVASLEITKEKQKK